MIPARQRRLAGRHARVDGIPFLLPVDSSDSPVLMAGFSIDADRARALMPGEELHPLRLPGGRGLLLITVIDYRVTDIGTYIEFSIAIACTRGLRRAPMVLPGLFRRAFGTGQYVVDLPVSTEVSVKGGKGIWGMPKHQANLDFTIAEDEVASQYDLDGQLAMRIEVDRPAGVRLPVRASAVNYCQFRGLLMKSTIYFRGGMHVALGRRASARLYLGSHPRMDPLRELDIASDPVFAAWLPTTSGVLDDHFEGWFLTSPEPVTQVPEGLETVAELGRSEDWLEPPKVGR
ncbi:acetoacetate decarboxylase family protein [Egicoccus sp. AB-alg6-2]|uniref:acetoacetate decarboxylase family protein n=1 Tax=Egicoccus sp. AB-alg6-2 TaxID=3242692 RepID=UPI00359EFA60